MLSTRASSRLRAASLAAVACVVLALALTACDDEEPDPKPVALAIIDETSSFDEFAPDCARDLLTVARGVAARRGHLYAGPLLTGNPYSETFSVDTDFDQRVPAAIEGNADLEEAYRERLAERLMPKFQEMGQATAAVGGSPVLSTLDRASSFRSQRAGDEPFWLVICSDLANIGDGLDVRDPIDDAEVKRTIDQWAPRLRGLKGAQLYFIGAGRLRPGSAARPESIRQVQGVVRGLAHRLGADVLLIDTQLGETFPIERD